MAYKATVLRVMIASPGDVSEERAIIRSIIHDWNDVNSTMSEVMLAPIGWDTHSSPELGERPQELINKRLLKDCDLLVGVFWTRLGTPTGKERSGSVEEILEHVKMGKPAMIYFSSKPIAPGSYDQAQFNEVLAFKEQCKNMGLIEGFDTHEEFKSKFSKQLNFCLAHNDYIKKTLESFGQPNAASEVKAPSPDPTVRLSEDAATLLKAAASQTDGMIMRISHLSGRFIQAGGKQFGGGRGREAAQWDSALNQLIAQQLVVGRGYKGEVFELTQLGWSTADVL